MVHRYHLFATTLAALSLGSIAESASLRSGSEQEGEDPDWIKANMTVEKGFKCKAGADKTKMGASRECEGGFKQAVSAQLSPKEISETVIVPGILDLRSDMMKPDQKNLPGPPEVVLEELVRWDTTEPQLVFEGQDCSLEDCKKKLEFGGYAKVFWGCNITFSMNGKNKVHKDVECGGKSFEGAGSKSKEYNYFAASGDKKGSAEALKMEALKKDAFKLEALKKGSAKALEMKAPKSKEIAASSFESPNKPPSVRPVSSAYDVFFSYERAMMNDQSGSNKPQQQQVEELIAQRWKELPEETREAYQKFAEADAIRYEAEMELYSVLSASSGKPKPPAFGLEQH